MDYFTSKTRVVTITSLAEFLDVDEYFLTEAVEFYAIEETQAGQRGIAGTMVLRLLQRAGSLDPSRYPTPLLSGRNRARGGGTLTPKLRQHILDRDERRCRYCGDQALGALQIDHIFPIVRGGTNSPVNLAAACAACNSRKRANTVKEAGMKLRELPGLGTELNDQQQELANGRWELLYDLIE